MKLETCFRFLLSASLPVALTAIALAQTRTVSVDFELPGWKSGQRSTYEQFIDPVNGRAVDEVVEYAKAHNGELAAARATIDEVRGRLRQAGLKANPMLETSGTKGLNGPDNNLMVGVELPLELGGRLKARVLVAQRELAMREAEVRDFERRLAAETRSKYIEAMAVARNLKFAEELLRFDRDSHEIVRARVETGKSAPIELSQLGVELNRTEASLINLDSRMEQAMLELKRVIGMPPEENLRLRAEYTGSQPVAQVDALGPALDSRPDLVALRAAESLAEAQVDQARREGKIDMSLFANYQRMDFNFDVRGFDDSGRLVPVAGIFHYATFGLRLTLPVRNGNQGLIEAATASVEAAHRRREFAEKVVRNEVEAAYARYRRSQSALDVYTARVRVPAAQNLDVIHKTYTLGYKTALDYLAEQRRFAEIETSYTDALKEEMMAISEIERVTGVSGRSPVKQDR